MNYEDTIQYLYNSAPLFQHIGGQAYKEGLQTTHILDAHFGHPHEHFKTIHVAGTNGKGSCAHTIAAVLQSAGYRVGLYTSPHLLDFRERIRVNGEQIPQQYVVEFVETEKSFFEPLHPSFFEITTAMAFKFFKDERVDVAVVEVGLGGRLDCTNIIVPQLSIITNIGFDHMQFLGNTYESIAREKAGIIKSGIPVVVGEYNEETRSVFEQKAHEMQAPIVFASDFPLIGSSQEQVSSSRGRMYQTKEYGPVYGELAGIYQEKNANTILHAIHFIRKAGFEIGESHVKEGFARVCELTGLRGRWQVLSDTPYIVCDTAHNIDGFKAVVPQILSHRCKHLRIVMGVVGDKDVDSILRILPSGAIYYFTKPSVSRALSEKELSENAHAYGLNGDTYPSVEEAFRQASADAGPEDMIYVGGSNFVVADLLESLV